MPKKKSNISKKDMFSGTRIKKFKKQTGLSLSHLALFALSVGLIGGFLLFKTLAGGEITSIGTQAPASEGSGLAASKQYSGVFWWIRDGGPSTASKPREAIYALKMDSDGNLKNVRNSDKFPNYKINGVSNNNWEDIAVDDNENIWIGDIGANNCSRKNQKFIKIKEPGLSRTTNINVQATYTFKFPDPAEGCNTYNSEAMFWLDGKLYIFAKTKNSPVYRVDLPGGDSGTATLKRLGTLKGGVSNISASSISDDRSRLMVAAHKQMFVFETDKTNLTGDDLVKELISDTPVFNAPFNCKCDKNESVEGGSFLRNSYDAAFIAENKYIYHANPSDYGDAAGNTPPGGEDTTPPTVTINSPKEGETVSGKITIDIEAEDSSGVERVKITHEDGTIRGGEEPGNYGWGSRFDTTTISDGDHTITVLAEDKVGNKVTVERNIKVKNNQGDSASPSVTIISPTDGATVKGKITINVSASDNVGLSSVKIVYDDGAGTIRGGDSPGNYGWGSRFDTTRLSNGIHTISAIATDTSGNTSTSTITVNVKN